MRWQRLVLQRRGAVAVGDRDPDLVAGSRQCEERGVGDRELASGGHDQREHFACRRATEQPGRDLPARLQPALPLLALLVEPRVLNRESRGGRKCQHELLVSGGELTATALLGEVEVAEHLASHQNRYAEEGAHRRMVRWKAERARVPADVRQPNRAGFVDEQAEHTAAVGNVTDPVTQVLIEAHGDELREAPFTTGREDAQCRIFRVRDVRGGVHDLLQHAVEVELRADRDDSRQQTL